MVEHPAENAPRHTGTSTGAGADNGPDADERFHALLRSLRVWDCELPAVDPDPAHAPADPLPFFRQWLREAAEAGVPEPHTMTLATADASGDPNVRTLMLHDADERGWHFATHRGSRKGRELATRPRAALGFYWAGLGRQVRVRGRVTEAGPEESAADLHRRSTGALAAALVGRQSEVLASYADLERASEAAWDRARQEPDAPVPSWTLYVLRPDEVEFFQGDARRRHVRINYRREGAIWARELLWP
ncbi:pyridoxine/pyridoxamine 5'-phosphate oxidase [Streptomyces monomycini]|uniref:pyridoxine/pyridoxamine 5'-phosphate oxidase n=1 Tax=Streptomyces monomycini TaxID=371720 RepID=UPI0004AAA63D|nr:pyridoxal 5'-phosphate synthase [Streptomyces monomycini]